MSSAITLIPHSILTYLHLEYSIGVPVTKLIERHKLAISRPTLTNLLKMYSHALSADGEARSIISMSLFPDWLEKLYASSNKTDKVFKQPREYKYNGIMPMGQWEKITGVNNEAL